MGGTPVGSWIQGGNMGINPRASGGPNPVLGLMQEQKPLPGWGTMAQVPEMISSLSTERTPMPEKAQPLGASIKEAAPTPSIATAMQAAPAYGDIPSVRRANERAREAAQGGGSVTPAPAPAAPAPPPPAAAGPAMWNTQPMISSLSNMVGGPKPPAPPPGGMETMGAPGGFQTIASNIGKAIQPQNPNIAAAMKRGGFAGRRNF